GGGVARPDLDLIERCRAQSLAWLAQLTPERAGFREDARLSFHAHTIAGAVLAAGSDALVASGLADPESMAAERRSWYSPPTAVRLQTPHRVKSVAAVA